MKQRKPVKAIAKSPKVSITDGKIPAKYAKGGLGRAYPANVDKVKGGMGNPVGAKKK